MDHATPLISIVVAGIGLAFAFGVVANRLRISPPIGYLFAGIAIGPFTPGYVADQHLAAELAEIGVILLMFGVGLHFSLRDLMSVRAIALPGAIVQMTAATLLGMALAYLFHWPIGASIVFGFALSIASTVVLLRGLEERRLMDTEVGRIAMGWLVVQDLLTVIALVLLPALADVLRDTPGVPPPDPMTLTIGLAITLGKVAIFVGLMLVVGQRAIPAILHYIALTGSHELFRLAVLSVALCVAFAASAYFGISFALGAFFAGMVLSESPLSQRAAEETLPLRDAFAVLFFVSVGMLIDPSIVLRQPVALALTCLCVLVGNAGVAIVLMRLMRLKPTTALTVGVGLAQIGEFSFILADLGGRLSLLPPPARDLILGASILTIFINPLLATLVRRFVPTGMHAASIDRIPQTSLEGHAVLIGFGRVGRLVAEALLHDRRPLLVVDENRDLGTGAETIVGNGARPAVLAAANLPHASILIVAIPNAFDAGQIVEQARAIAPSLEIVARAHTEAEAEHLTAHGATSVVMGQREIARTILEHVRE